MNEGQGFGLHPEAALDITEIWEYIASDNPQTARSVREDILDAVRNLIAFRIKVTGGPMLRLGPFASSWSGTISLPMPPWKSRFGWWQ